MHSTAPYSDSQFPGSPLEQEAKSGEDALFGQTADPQCAIQKEHSDHHKMILMSVGGDSNKRIAEVLNYSEVHVGNILRQPWARRKINAMCKEMKVESAMEILRKAVPRAALKLVELMEDDRSSREVQGKNATAILDRIYGKPKEKVEHSGSIDLDKMSDRELAALLPPTIRSDFGN